MVHKDEYKQRTIMEMPARAWTVDRSPSDMFIVTDWPTSVVSVDRRLINSPVLFQSKNATSCRTTDENSCDRRLRTMRLPWQHRHTYKAECILDRSKAANNYVPN